MSQANEIAEGQPFTDRSGWRMSETNTCSGCVNFCNDGGHIEHAFSGLSIMSSGYGAVRAADGLCGRHNFDLANNAGCNDREAKRLVRASRPARRKSVLATLAGGLASLLRFTRSEPLTDALRTRRLVVMQPGFTLIEEAEAHGVAHGAPTPVGVRSGERVPHVPYPLVAVRNCALIGAP